jgi:CheY-like chemotaxis protein
VNGVRSVRGRVDLLASSCFAPEQRQRRFESLPLSLSILRQERGIMRKSLLRVLVADDHEVMRSSLARILRQEFDVIGIVSNGVDLVRDALILQPDVVVTDVNMPELGGIGAMDQLTAAGVTVPFVFVSANEDVVRNLTKILPTCVSKADLIYKLNPAVRTAARTQTREYAATPSPFLA